MALDVIPGLGTILDGVTATGGGRTQRFRYLPWPRHLDADSWSSIQSATVGGGTEVDTVFTIRPISRPKRNADIGGGAALARQRVDVMAWWQDGSDITDPALYRKAVEEAFQSLIRTNEKLVSTSLFTQVVDILNGDELMGGETGTLKHLAIVSVEGESDEVYA